MKTFFTLILLSLTATTLASTKYHLKCLNSDAYTDLGPAILELDTTIIVNGKNDYSLQGGFFNLTIDEDWTNQMIALEEVKNLSTYKPRVYKEHAKFPDFAKGFFGMADLIIPHASLTEGLENITVHFILSWVDDHWGGTISADCKMTPMN